jgi:hypothetical protein
MLISKAMKLGFHRSQLSREFCFLFPQSTPLGFSKLSASLSNLSFKVLNIVDFTYFSKGLGSNTSEWSLTLTQALYLRCPALVVVDGIVVIPTANVSTMDRSIEIISVVNRTWTASFVQSWYRSGVDNLNDTMNSHHCK